MIHLLLQTLCLRNVLDLFILHISCRPWALVTWSNPCLVFSMWTWLRYKRSATAFPPSFLLHRNLSMQAGFSMRLPDCLWCHSLLFVWLLLVAWVLTILSAILITCLSFLLIFDLLLTCCFYPNCQVSGSELVCTLAARNVTMSVFTQECVLWELQYRS